MECDTETDNKLMEIYYNPGDSGYLGGCDRLLKRARELHFPVTKCDMGSFLTKKQIYTFVTHLYTYMDTHTNTHINTDTHTHTPTHTHTNRNNLLIN